MKPPLRTKSVGTKVSEAEFALLEERARGAGMRLAEWVREALLAAPVEPVANSGVEAGGRAVVYGPAGEKLGVFNGSTYTTAFLLPGGSEAYYTSGALTSLRRKDWLGSSRVATSWSHAVVSKAAYAPFGESYSVGGTTDLDFTGQTQDSVSSLYDFPARKYDPGAGRWTVPDPGGWSVVDLTNPQSFNRYAYVLNMPLVFIDPSGMDDPCVDDPTPACTITVTADPPPPCYEDASCAPPDPPLTTLLPYQPTPVYGGPGGDPNNGPTPNPCQATLLNMANQQLGTNFNSSNVAGSYMNGTAYNIIIQSNQLTAGQFNNIQQGRYTTSGWQYLTGAGLAGHIADETNLGFAQSAFQSSNIGGNLSVSFAFHDDHGYANNPIGALIHWITDVLGHNTRKPC